VRNATGNEMQVARYKSFVDEITDDMRKAYLSDNRPWIVGFSGGKDSTMLVQLLYYMLATMRIEERRKHVYVLASDTRVEAPSIATRIRRELTLLMTSAERDGLPITTHLVYPKLNDTFWVNLIGRGYPSPTAFFRWCTDRLKIRPVSNFIKRVVTRSGSVVVVLGARKAESNTRAQAMRTREIENQRFHPHSDLLNAWVYTPLENFTNNDVWIYLLQVPNPWGGDNRGLVTLYRRAAGGECPLVIDTSTPSCGQSRFGCWTCTVIENDRTAEALVELGEDHLQPLLEFRDYLKEIRDRPGVRQDKRRNGKPAYSRKGELMKGTGPFTHGTRRELLIRLLEAQKRSGHVLIEGDELAAIQQVWSREEDNPQPVDTVQGIWTQVYKEKSMLNKKKHENSHLSKEETLLRDVCEKHGISFEMMRRLRDLEEEFGHLKRRHGLPEEMRDVVRQAQKLEEESTDAPVETH
jgi:DNA sulfur modification protein DndC